MPTYLWSTTAANNATADPNINWAEGQSPSSVNDSARAQMASEKEFFNDAVSMANTTTGTSTAYALATQSVFDTLAHLDKQQLTFIPHTTSGASPTLNVDGTGAKPINGPASGTAIPTGALVQGVPYAVTYDNSNNQFLLLNYRDTLNNAVVAGTLGVVGNSTFTGSVAFNNTSTINGTMTFNGAAANETATSLVSNGVVSIGAAPANYITITGNNTITSFDLVQAGTQRTLKFSGALTLTHSSTSLSLPGSVSISTATNDTAIFRSEATTVAAWRCVEYTRAAHPPAGLMPTVQQFTTTGNFTYTASSGATFARIRIPGSGGGGGAAVTNSGTTGTATVFGGWSANPGLGGAAAGGAGGAGGSGGTTGSGTLIVRTSGAQGAPGQNNSTTGTNPAGGDGGQTPFGGRGAGGTAVGNNGNNAATNTGSGGGGASNSNSSSGGGGGAGENVEFWYSLILNPVTTGVVGTRGIGGAAGTHAGGNGADGGVYIEEFYL